MNKKTGDNGRESSLVTVSAPVAVVAGRHVTSQLELRYTARRVVEMSSFFVPLLSKNAGDSSLRARFLSEFSRYSR